MKKNAVSITIPIAAICVAAVISAAFIGVVGAMSVAIIGILVWQIVRQVITDIKSSSISPITETKLHKKKFDYLYIILFVLVVRLGTYVFAYICSTNLGWASGSIFETFNRIWIVNRTDAAHYIGIAENWYVTQGDSMYHIVFFPLFPILLKAFYLIFRDYAVAAVIMNLLLSFGIGITAYEFCLLDFDRKTAFRFVKYIFIIPAAFFYAAPMTESTFVLFCLICLYFARKKKFVICAFFGALAAFTRSQGAILMLPCAYIAFTEYLKTGKEKGAVSKLLERWALTLCISIGLIGYLLINYEVWGNPTQFSIFQWEHWHQKLGFFGNTVQMIWDYLTGNVSKITDTNILIESPFRDAIALWIPQLIYVFCAPVVVAVAAIKRNKTNITTDETELVVKTNTVNTAYIAFFAAYYIISVGATWLLSAPRYLMACMTLPLCIAALTKSRIADIITTVICVLLGGAMLLLFSVASPIY